MLLADLRGEGLTNLLIKHQATNLWKLNNHLIDSEMAIGKQSVVRVLAAIRDSIQNGKRLSMTAEEKDRVFFQMNRMSIPGDDEQATALFNKNTFIATYFFEQRV